MSGFRDRYDEFQQNKRAAEAAELAEIEELRVSSHLVYGQAIVNGIEVTVQRTGNNCLAHAALYYFDGDSTDHTFTFPPAADA